MWSLSQPLQEHCCDNYELKPITPYIPSRQRYEIIVTAQIIAATKPKCCDWFEK